MWLSNSWAHAGPSGRIASMSSTSCRQSGQTSLFASAPLMHRKQKVCFEGREKKTTIRFRRQRKGKELEEKLTWWHSKLDFQQYLSRQIAQISSPVSSSIFYDDNKFKEGKMLRNEWKIEKVRTGKHEWSFFFENQNKSSARAVHKRRYAIVATEKQVNK